MRRYKSERERNLWHAAAESWRDSGRNHADEPHFLRLREWRRVVTVMAMMATGLGTLVVWRSCVGG